MKNNPVSTKRHNGTPNISAVILDYGQVLAHAATPEGFGRMAKILNSDLEAFYRLWEVTRDIYDRGDLTAEEYWLKLAGQNNSSLDRTQIDTLRKIELEIWSHLDQSMLGWVGQLRAGGIKTGLLSNMPCDLVTYLRANCRWLENFTFKTFSSEVRLVKPDAAIYERTLHGLGVPASEALFIDDKEVNIKAARALGIHGIQFRSVADLRDNLEASGFPILPAFANRLDAREARPMQPVQEIKFQL